MIMQIMNELKKLIVLKKGYLIFVIFVLINIFSVATSNVKNTRYSEEEEKLLEFYYEYFGTVHNEDNDIYITTYYALVSSDEYRVDTDAVIPDELKKEQINEKQVKEIMNSYYSSFNLAKNSGITDSIVDSRGWQYILQEFKNIDFLLCLSVIILSAIFFSIDKSRGQEDIVKCTRLGRGILAQSKLAALFICIILFEIIKQMRVVIPVVNTYYVDFAGIPLANVPYMHDVTININTVQAYIFVIICETVGLMFVGIITGLIIVIGGGAAEGFFTGFSFAYVPYFLFNKDNAYMRIPLPSAYLTPYNFLNDIQKYLYVYIAVTVIILAFLLMIVKIYRIEWKRIRIC